MIELSMVTLFSGENVPDEMKEDKCTIVLTYEQVKGKFYYEYMEES